MVRSAETVGDILGRLLRNSTWGRRVFEGKALLVWEDVVGESVKAHATALRVQDGKMIIAVEDAIWKQEVSLLQGEIIRKLNDRMGSDVVQDIVLVVR